jgi:DNA-directed RNA polymerase subunit H (RpoH/RPB5)
MDNFFSIYKNIQLFITKYRKYEIIDKFYNFEDFKKKIQTDAYIIHTCIDPINQKKVYIYLLNGNNPYTKSTSKFKRLFNAIENDVVNVILITKQDISIYINKSINTYINLNVSRYLHKHFLLEMSKGPLCSKHSILSKKEVSRLCTQDLILHPLSLPSISILDPQNIWIGGELGQIVKIESYSEMVGTAIRYRIVSPDSGKMNNLLKMNKNISMHKDTDNSDKNINDDNNEELENDITQFDDYKDENQNLSKNQQTPTNKLHTGSDDDEDDDEDDEDDDDDDEDNDNKEK